MLFLSAVFWTEWCPEVGQSIDLRFHPWGQQVEVVAAGGAAICHSTQVPLGFWVSTCFWAPGAVSYQTVFLCSLSHLQLALFSRKKPDLESPLWTVHLWGISFCGVWPRGSSPRPCPWDLQAVNHVELGFKWFLKLEGTQKLQSWSRLRIYPRAQGNVFF